MFITSNSKDLNWRFYSFTNYYISSIQKGIQTSHLVSEMSILKNKGTPYNDWAKNDKTVVVLNGGNARKLTEIYDAAVLFGKEHNFPVVKFNEDEDSLNGALTAVGILLPENVYEYARLQRERKFDAGFHDALNACELSNESVNFIALLNSCPLAH